MEIALLLFLLLVGPLALLAGRDSRIDEANRRRRYVGMTSRLPATVASTRWARQRHDLDRGAPLLADGRATRSGSRRLPSVGCRWAPGLVAEVGELVAALRGRSGVRSRPTW